MYNPYSSFFILIFQTFRRKYMSLFEDHFRRYLMGGRGGGSPPATDPYRPKASQRQISARTPIPLPPPYALNQLCHTPHHTPGHTPCHTARPIIRFSFHHQLPTVGTSVRKSVLCFNKIFSFINFPGGRYISLWIEQNHLVSVSFCLSSSTSRGRYTEILFFQEIFSSTAFYQNPAVHGK